MSEIMVLSNDLNVITAEINSYKQIAGHAVFEIGRRLQHVKETDLAKGQWTKWCDESIGLDRAQADKFIKVFTQLGEDECTYTRLGLRALYEISTMSEEQRSQTHTVPSTGEQKKVDEMTVKELREVKAALKDAQRSAEQNAQELAKARKERDFHKDLASELQRENTQLKDAPPVVIERDVEKIIEVVPDSIRERMAQLQRQIRDMEVSNEQTDKRYQELSDEYQRLLDDQTMMETDRAAWALADADRLYDEADRFAASVDEFIADVAKYSYLARYMNKLDSEGRKLWGDSVDKLNTFLKSLRTVEKLPFPQVDLSNESQENQRA